MYMDYYFYLNKLTEVEKNRQLLIFVLFWILMFVIANILQSIYISENEINEKNNSTKANYK